MGDERVTVQNLRILQVRGEEGVLVVAGAVPGANGSFVVVRPSKKRTAAAAKK
jgi:large subunit ribosomal protein L3